jgi:trk system potassium uptake protein TrkH
MFCGGLNFTLFYFVLKGRFKNIFQNEEFRFYIGTVFLVSILTWLVLLNKFPDTGWEESLRNGLFQVVSILTTTGFGTANYTLWGNFLLLVFFFLMFFGASAGSTSGGIKIVRHMLIVKNGFSEFRRILHPSAVIPVRYNGRAVDQKIIYNILAFFFIYLTVFILGCVVMTAFGYDIVTAAGATISSLGNIGPGIGEVSPEKNFAAFPESAKVFLALLMLVGRLELFTVILILLPGFWKRS